MTSDRRQVVWRPLGGPTVYKQWRFPSPVLQVGFDLILVRINRSSRLID